MKIGTITGGFCSRYFRACISKYKHEKRSVMVYGQLDQLGRLTNIRYAQGPSLPGDVYLITMPSGYGPFGYDAINKVAIPIPIENQTVDEKSSSVVVSTKILAALCVRNSASWGKMTVSQKVSVQQIIDDAGSVVATAVFGLK